jgi:RNA polymerase sigma-70 factor (ECF subfamily)
MLTQEEDQQLVERVQRGDRRAFDLLVLKYQHKILGLIVRFVHDTHEAQDVAQEAFIKAYRALGNFAVTARFIRGCTASPSTRRKTIWCPVEDGRQTAM